MLHEGVVNVEKCYWLMLTIVLISNKILQVAVERACLQRGGSFDNRNFHSLFTLQVLKDQSKSL